MIGIISVDYLPSNEASLLHHREVIQSFKSVKSWHKFWPDIVADNATTIECDAMDERFRRFAVREPHVKN